MLVIFDINWFRPILEYIINCIGKCLQILICLVKLFDFLSLFIVFVLFFFSTVLVNKDEYIYNRDVSGIWWHVSSELVGGELIGVVLYKRTEKHHKVVVI